MFIIVITCPHFHYDKVQVEHYNNVRVEYIIITRYTLSIYVIITRYELNCKRPEVALSYLDLAVRIDPEETLVGDEEEENRFGGGGGDSFGGGGGGGDVDGGSDARGGGVDGCGGSGELTGTGLVMSVVGW